MSSTDHIDEGSFVLRLDGRAARRPFTASLATPLRTALVTIYATAALLLLLMPHAALDWLDDMPPGPLTGLARSCVEPVAAVSDRLGLHSLYLAARRQTEALSRRAQ